MIHSKAWETPLSTRLLICYRCQYKLQQILISFLFQFIYIIHKLFCFYSLNWKTVIGVFYEVTVKKYSTKRKWLNLIKLNIFLDHKQNIKFCKVELIKLLLFLNLSFFVWKQIFEGLKSGFTWILFKCYICDFDLQDFIYNFQFIYMYASF